MQAKSKRGGYRPTAGGLVQILEMRKTDAQTLRTLLLSRYGRASKEQANAWLAGVIREQWQDYDAMIQALAEDTNVVPD